MNSEKSNVSRGGMGLAGVLLVVFIVLKLVGVITWSWLWVLSPLWISVGLVLVIFLITLVVVAITQHKN